MVIYWFIEGDLPSLDVYMTYRYNIYHRIGSIYYRFLSGKGVELSQRGHQGGEGRSK